MATIIYTNRFGLEQIKSVLKVHGITHSSERHVITCPTVDPHVVEDILNATPEVAKEN